MKNIIMVIKPYWYEGTWVFDDELTGLNKEPFVEGIPEMINDLVIDIQNAHEGFKMLFSASPFPGFQRELIWQRADFEGNWYKMVKTDKEGWLCSALFEYFNKAPKHLYVKAEAIK